MRPRLSPGLSAAHPNEQTDVLHGRRRVRGRLPLVCVNPAWMPSVRRKRADWVNQMNHSLRGRRVETVCWSLSTSPTSPHCIPLGFRWGDITRESSFRANVRLATCCAVCCDWPTLSMPPRCKTGWSFWATGKHGMKDESQASKYICRDAGPTGFGSSGTSEGGCLSIEPSSGVGRVQAGLMSVRVSASGNVWARSGIGDSSSHPAYI